MSITMRVIQQYDIRKETEFLELEKEFAKLERRRKDYSQGRRLRPIAAAEPINTLVWECEFEDVEKARAWLGFIDKDPDHGELLARQSPFFKQVRIEFYENLDY